MTKEKMFLEDIKEELHLLDTETFEVEDFNDLEQDVGSCSSTSCSSCCSSSTSCSSCTSCFTVS
jgi:hypothetical protein